MHAVALFAHFNLDFLREVLRIGARTVLDMNFRGDFQFTARAAVNLNLAEAVIQAEALISRERKRLLKIARDFALSRIIREYGNAGRQK
jgi:hypothetical protein